MVSWPITSIKKFIEMKANVSLLVLGMAVIVAFSRTHGGELSKNQMLNLQQDFIFETESCPDNALFGELIGNGLGLSANYERFFSQRFGFRIGYGIIGRTVPLMVNYYVGKKYQLELGLGVVFQPGWKDQSLTEETAGPIIVSSTIGFKFDATPCGGFFVRASLTPFYNPENSRGRVIAGLSVGSSF